MVNEASELSDPSAPPPPPTDAANTSADLIQHKKYQDRIDRLAALNSTRLQESSARKSTMAATIDPRESVDLFLSSFSQKREAAEIALALARTKQIQPPTSLKDHLLSLSLSITAMDKSLADSSFFLPNSVVKASQNTITKLRDEVESANAELIQKKKFSFRHKVKTPLPHPEVPPSKLESSVSSETLIAPSESSEPTKLNSMERIEGQTDGTFARDANELGGELTLSNLTNCKVYLRGRLTTLVIHSLTNCQVFSGPVSGSVFIESVQDSVLVLASHQIRIHSTSGTDFYLRVRSRPIVEGTSKVRFAPYAFGYRGVEEDLRAANLGEETGLWEKVDDFRWLRAVHSPNWSVLPNEERIAVEDGSGVMGVGIGD